MIALGGGAMGGFWLLALPCLIGLVLATNAVALLYNLGWLRPLGWLRRAGQFFFALSFSSLTRRIVSLNLAGLVALVASILYLSQFRAGLIDARALNLARVAAEVCSALEARGVEGIDHLRTEIPLAEHTG